METIVFSKTDFIQLVDKNQIDIRPIDKCFYNNSNYSIKTLDKDNRVILEPITHGCIKSGDKRL